MHDLIATTQEDNFLPFVVGIKIGGQHTNRRNLNQNQLVFKWDKCKMKIHQLMNKTES